MYNYDTIIVYAGSYGNTGFMSQIAKSISMLFYCQKKNLKTLHINNLSALI